MNLVEYLRRQFSYNEWANREVLTQMRAEGADARSLQLMGHILSAEQLWLRRIRQQPQNVPVWPNVDVEQCEALSAEMARLWNDYLEEHQDDFSKTISYQNSKGEPWSSTVVDILAHVIMHSAYHRGQIASHMRESGKTPVCTDFIHAVRQEIVK